MFCFCYVVIVFFFFFFKQKTAYEWRISDWSSDLCSSDLRELTREQDVALDAHAERQAQGRHFRQAERSQFGLAEIGETEQCVAVLVEFGRQPGADAERIEEADDGDMIAVARTAVGEQALAQLRSEQVHAALRASEVSSSSEAGSASGRKASSQSRSEEHTSELQSLMRISYAVFCLKKKTKNR